MTSHQRTSEDERRTSSSISETVIVDTIYGPIRGLKRYTIYDDCYYSFEGVPFAQPPIGLKRFKAPQPPKSWTQVLNCTKHRKPQPIQKHYIYQTAIGSEDCLYLNVYTKNLATDTTCPLPVMVWFYGGGFQYGESSPDLYSPDYLLRAKVVVITFAYRLGALGFLSMTDPSLEVPGNAGLKDQVMALNWIKLNCTYFGGDCNNITLFGHGAGAASIHFMMLTKQAQGLFHKVICMSGTALAPWAVLPSSQTNWAYRLARAIGYNSTVDHDQGAILDFLREASTDDIVKASDKLCTSEDIRSGQIWPFGPIIEPYTTEKCVISCRPQEMMRSAWSNHFIPMVIGGVSNEGLVLYNEIKSDSRLINDVVDCRYSVPIDVTTDPNEDLSKAYGRILMNTYFDGKQVDLKTEASLEKFLLMFSHEYFWFPIYRTVLSRIQYSSLSSTFLYYFDFDSKHFNHLRTISCGHNSELVHGTCHGDELSYLFHNSLAPKLKTNTKEYQCIEALVGLWTHFAVYGHPPPLDDEGTIWPPVVGTPTVTGNSQSLHCLYLGSNENDIKVAQLPNIDKISVWKHFFSPDQFL